MKLLSEVAFLTVLATAVATGTAPSRDAPPASGAESEPRPRPGETAVRGETAVSGAAETGGTHSENASRGATEGAAGSEPVRAERPSPESAPPNPLLLEGAWGDFVDRPVRKPRERLTPQEIEIRIVVAKDISAQLGERLEVLCKRDPETCQERLLDSNRLDPFVELWERDKNLYQKKVLALRADAEVDRLARELAAVRRVGHEADEKALLERLRMYVRMQIALGHDARRAYLCQLRDLVEHLEKELEKEQEALTDEAVEKRIAKLLSDVEAAREPSVPQPE